MWTHGDVSFVSILFSNGNGLIHNLEPASDSGLSRASIDARALHEDEPPSFAQPQPSFAPTANVAPDSFKTEYHPKSGRTTEYESFSAYGQRPFVPSLPDDTPWALFLSRADFEIAELAHQSAMSREQVEHLLKLIWLISNSPRRSGFTLRLYNNVANAWSCVTPKLTPVCPV